MRKIITIVVASLIPIGMWTAGCRQNNRQAAFPKSSELKGLAKADAPGKNKPPRIEPAPIDRDVLNYNQTGAVARATAVDDRSRQIAKPKPDADLFSLPDMNGSMNGSVASASYNPQPADIGPAPAPVGREFRSRPVDMPAGRRSGQTPADVSAMAPADNGFAGPPVQFLPPPPASKPAAKAGSSNGLFMDDIPGVYLEGSPISQLGSPPGTGPRKSQNESFRRGDALGAPPLLTKRENATPFEKIETPAAAASSSASLSEGPMKLDLSGLLGGKARKPEPVETARRHESVATVSTIVPAAAATSFRSFDPHDSPPMIVRAIPGDYEPLPEPIPLAEYMAMTNRTFPEPVAKMPERRRRPDAIQSGAIQSDAIQIGTSAKASGGLSLPLPAAPPPPQARPKAVADSGLVPLPPTAKRIAPDVPAEKPVVPASSLDMKKALEPLPNLSSVSSNVSSSVSSSGSTKDKIVPDKKPETSSRKISSPALTLPPPLASAKAELPGGGLTGGIESFAELELPELKPPPARRNRPEPADPAAAKKNAIAPLEPLAPLGSIEPPAEIETPRKVKLQPVRRVRDKELMRIDSEMEVPPMKF